MKNNCPFFIWYDLLNKALAKAPAIIVNQCPCRYLLDKRETRALWSQITWAERYTLQYSKLVWPCNEPHEYMSKNIFKPGYLTGYVCTCNKKAKEKETKESNKTRTKKNVARKNDC